MYLTFYNFVKLFYLILSKLQAYSRLFVLVVGSRTFQYKTDFTKLFFKICVRTTCCGIDGPDMLVESVV